MDTTRVVESYDRTHNQSLNRWIRFDAEIRVFWAILPLPDDTEPIAEEKTGEVSRALFPIFEDLECYPFGWSDYQS